MLGALFIFFITYFFIVTERIDRTVAALIGGVLVIHLQLIPYHEAVARIDLNVVFLLLGMMIVVHLLSETGLFEWLAVTIAQKADGDGLKILIGLVAATAVLSAFLDNVTTVVLIAPVTILITQILGLPTALFLILEALASNIGGAATLIGDPPNILIGSHTHLHFNDFIVHMGPPSVLVFIAFVGLIIVLRPSLKVAPEARERIRRARPERAITDPRGLRIGLVVFGLTLLGFFLGHYLGMEPGVVALAGALAMMALMKQDVNEAFDAVEWPAIFFLIGLFMLVGALDHNGLFDLLSNWMQAATGGDYFLTLCAILWMSGLAAAFLGAVPTAMAMIPLVGAIIAEFEAGGRDLDPLWWALALGACLGANGTLLGSATNVITVQIARRNKCEIGFGTFARFGFPLAMLSLLICTAYLYARYVWWAA